MRFHIRKVQVRCSLVGCGAFATREVFRRTTIDAARNRDPDAVEESFGRYCRRHGKALMRELNERYPEEEET